MKLRQRFAHLCGHDVPSGTDQEGPPRSGTALERQKPRPSGRDFTGRHLPVVLPSGWVVFPALHLGTVIFRPLQSILQQVDLHFNGKNLSAGSVRRDPARRLLPVEPQAGPPEFVKDAFLPCRCHGGSMGQGWVPRWRPSQTRCANLGASS